MAIKVRQTNGKMEQNRKRCQEKGENLEAKRKGTVKIVIISENKEMARKSYESLQQN